MANTDANRMRKPIPCVKCGCATYRKAKVCRVCEPPRNRFAGVKRRTGPLPIMPDPRIWPEDYLLACAKELQRRHVERAEQLRAILIPEAA